jgi:recombination protein RecA
MAKKRNKNKGEGDSEFPENEENEVNEDLQGAENAMAAIKKRFGDGAIIRGDGTIIKDIESISSGSLAVDIALGIGGFPKGRICEIFGAEGSGKTTLALSTVACAQRAGGTAAYIDAEHALDLGYSKDIGVNMSKLLVSQPDSGEEVLTIAEILCKSKSVDVIIIDSVAAIVPKAELDGEIGDSHIAAQARLMSQSLRKIKGVVNQSKTALIFINQIREKAGMSFGNPETTPGGRALKFYASVRVDLRKVEGIRLSSKGEEAPIGHIVRAHIIKNKVASPFKKAEFEIYYGKGISEEADILNLGEQCKIIQRTGSWLSYASQKLGQGKQPAIKYLKDNPNIAKELKEMILDLMIPNRKRREEDGSVKA